MQKVVKMKFIFKSILGLLTLLASIVVGFVLWLFLSLKPTPSVQGWQNSSPSLSQAEQWIGQVQADLDSNKLFRLEITTSDLQSLIYYWSNRLNALGADKFQVHGAASSFTGDKLLIRISVKSNLVEPRYINAEFMFSAHEGKPVWDYFKMIGVTLSGNTMSWMWQKQILPLLPSKRAQLWKTITGAVKDFEILPDRAVLVYRSNKELREQIKTQAMEWVVGDKEEVEAIELYLSVLRAAASQYSVSELSLSKLMRTLVGLAKSRSVNSSAVDENRRMIRAFAIQVADASVRSLLAPGVTPRSLGRPIILRGRFDLTQHFLISASLALILDEQTALDIGVSKELSDAKAGGSGFSFSDLAADMAGIRFATALTESEQRARWAQDYLLANSGEQVLMPKVAWLPQGLTTTAYSDLVRHPLYPAMLDRIIKSLNAVPLFADNMD